MFAEIIRKVRKSQAKKIFMKKVKTLSERDVCIDCGANVGEITALLSATGARVYAFEPEPMVFDMLKQRFSDRKNVVLFNAAVATKAGRMKLYRKFGFEPNSVKKTAGSSLILEKENVTDENAVEVDVVDFLQFCSNLPSNITILKMDIEGAEVDILEKLVLQDGLFRKFKNIFVETHEEKIPKTRLRVEELAKILKKSRDPYVNMYWK
jgi:FkbM family methyltransferase